MHPIIPSTPALAGTTPKERLLSCLGALLGIAATALMLGLMLPSSPALAYLIAPLGASAVLLFAVPTSPLAQPWPVLGGNALSAIVGTAVAHAVPPGALGAGLAVAAAMLTMSLLRCLHPPGGAVALLAVLGGPGDLATQATYPAVVAANSALLVLAGWAFHRARTRTYPHGAALRAPSTTVPAHFTQPDIDAALADLGASFDVNRADLQALLERAQVHAARRHAAPAAATTAPPRLRRTRRAWFARAKSSAHRVTPER